MMLIVESCVDAYRRVVMMPIVESCGDAYSGELW